MNGALGLNLGNNTINAGSQLAKVQLGGLGAKLGLGASDSLQSSTAAPSKMDQVMTAVAQLIQQLQAAAQSASQPAPDASNAAPATSSSATGGVPNGHHGDGRAHGHGH
ncbi:MAG: hypothetical protein ACREM6_12075 [Vulcanimicrobiaceae bacterium]